jgi:hypothetical protein
MPFPRSHFALAALLLGMAGTVAYAQDPMASPACADARQALDDALTTAGPGLAAARRRAGEACLGRTAGAGREGGPTPSPLAVAPIPVPGPAALPPAPPLPPGFPVTPGGAPPAAITSCDAAGCWDSNGARHNQQGPLLAGPRGLCALQGGLLVCP